MNIISSTIKTTTTTTITRRCLLRIDVIYRCYQASSSNSFNKIKTLYNEGKEVDAIDEYFKNPNPFAASFLIARQNEIDMSLKIYKAAKTNSSLDLFVIMSLISALEKRNEHNMNIDTVFDDSMIEINKMQTKDIAKIKLTNWSFILKSICMRSTEKHAINLVDIMKKHCINLDIRIYTILLKACTDKRWIELGKRIHSQIEQNGKMDLITKNCLINMYGNCGYLEQAIKIFNNIRISERDIITWTAMMLAFGKCRKGKEASALFIQMQKEGLKPNNQTITCILKACCAH